MTRSEAPLVSIIVPARNEEEHIGHCLQAIGNQDYPLSQLEVIVVDGASDDRTVDLCRDMLWEYDFKSFVVVGNPRSTTPTSLNHGLAKATGTYICRVDARSILPEDYVSRCCDLLENDSGISVVGGSQVAIAPPGSGVVRSGITRALNNRYSMGGARYRSGATSGRSDTAYLGFFNAEHLRSIDGWDESLPTNQDFDVCQRIAALGEVWFLSDLPVGYVGRKSLASLARQYRRFGQWKGVYWRTRRRPLLRQLLLLAVTPLVAPPVFLLAVRAPRSAAAIIAAALLGIDQIGSRRGTEDGLHIRLSACLAMVTIGASWSLGAWLELLVPSERPLGHDREKDS